MDADSINDVNQGHHRVSPTTNSGKCVF